MGRLLPAIEELAPYTPGLSIAEIQEKFHLGEVIKLASNENPLGASPLVQEAVRRHAAQAFRYPQAGNPRLVQALAAHHKVDASQVAVGNGSDEIIDLLIRMTAGPKHNIACFQPCFSIYPIQARINGIETRRLPLAADFGFDFAKLLDLVDDKTRLVFITTPDNPSGYCPSRGSVAALARDLGRIAPDALLVIDEAYMDFAEDENALSLLASGLLPENAVFLRTFSKSFGLAGLRAGYAIMPAPLAAGFWRSRLPFSVNVLAEEAALAALKDDTFRKATLEAVKDGRAMLTSGLESLGCRVWPSSANFLLFQLPGGQNAGSCFESLLKKGVIIRPLNSYGLPEHLRVSVGSSRENGIFLAALKEFLSA